jgi:hypothetical protein
LARPSGTRRGRCFGRSPNSQRISSHERTRKLNYSCRLCRISNTSRSSLYAARLVFPSSSSPPSSSIFRSLAEFPLDPALTSFSISLPSASTDFQCFTVSPMGIDQLVISQPTLDNLFPSSSTVEPASANGNATLPASAPTDDVEAHLLAPTPPSKPSTPVEPTPAEVSSPSAEADIVPDALEIKQEPVEDAPIPPALAVAAAQPEQENIPAAADIKPVNEEKKATTSRKVESSERERKRTQSSRSSVKHEIKEDGVIGGGGEKVDVSAIGAKLQRQTKEVSSFRVIMNPPSSSFSLTSRSLLSFFCSSSLRPP